MRFPKGYAGVKKLFTSEILNIIASLLFFATSVITVFASQKITNPQYLPVIVILLMLSGLAGLVAFVLQIIGLNQARKDDSHFRTALIFVFAGIAASLVAFATGGTFGNIFSSINEVATLLVSVYTILGIYDLAEEMESANVMLHGKIALFAGASVFVTAIIFRIIPVFVPRTEVVFDVICAVMEIIGYFVFLIYIGKARKMLSKKA